MNFIMDCLAEMFAVLGWTVVAGVISAMAYSFYDWIKSKILS